MKKLIILILTTTLFANVTNDAVLTIDSGVTVTINGYFANSDTVFNEGTLAVNGNYYELGGGSVIGDGTFSFDLNNSCIDLNEGANLISLSALPTIPSVSELPECISGIIGEGVGAINLDGTWIGSLTELSCEDGYWMLNSCADFEWCYDGMDCFDEMTYGLHYDNNLISYPLDECCEIADVLPEDVQECIYAMAGEGMAALNTNNGWIGSLSELCPNDGYWFVSLCDMEFSYNECTALSRTITASNEEQLEEGYGYTQSTKQAFYFIESVENIEVGDWLLSYNGDKLIGSRQWQGMIVDVPAMGDDGNSYSEGYLSVGEAPQFKLLKDDLLIDLEGDIAAFEDNGFFIVSNLTQTVPIPNDFSLSKAYPNPFNPVTTLNFGIPHETEVFLKVYNLQGREVSTLIDGNMEAGYHSVVWNANSAASGVYFVKMIAGDFVSTQKLMLIK